MSEQLEAQLAGMGTGALSEVGLPTLDAVQACALGLNCVLCIEFLVVCHCDLGTPGGLWDGSKLCHYIQLIMVFSLILEVRMVGGWWGEKEKFYL